MKIPIIVLCVAFAAAACHDRTKMQRSQQDYQVVQEGSANGVTSTINGSDEVRPPVATDTNADTTTNFTLPPVAGNGAMSTNGGSVASTLPQTSGTTPATAVPGTPPPPPRGTETINAPMTSATPATPPAQRVRPSRPPQRQPEPTTTQQEGPPTQSDTSATTATQPPPTDSTSTQKTDTTKTDQKKNDNPPPSDTSSSQPPPPPPPMTDGVLPDANGRDAPV